VKYVKLGTTGLEVSRICLGGMSYGAPDRGDHIWTLPLDEARPLINAALEAGVNFFDTANGYSAGSSEEVLGTVLRESVPRDEVVIATKVHNRMRAGANGAGLSRKVIMTEIDHSLRRLGVDYVDLYQIHRWDPTTPIEETLEALHDVVRAGKARYIGASSMAAWQFCQAIYTSRLHGWSEFVSMQDHYNLLSRDEEREMYPLCLAEGIGVIPWSPLARGRLTRPWGETTERMENDALGQRLYRPEEDRKVIDRVGALAGKLGVTRAQVALAWVLRNPLVASPIIGVTKRHHLDDAVAAVDLRIDDEVLAAL
jgi:aryl-alcohol dehydrogenase-like predicted oxidoreductase